MNEDWNEAYSVVMPLLGVVISVLGVALTLLTLYSRAQGVGGLEPASGVAVDVPRVRYSEGNVLVDVRDGNWYKLQDFVQPLNPEVIRIVRSIT